jgi:cell division protein FtsB
MGRKFMRTAILIVCIVMGVGVLRSVYTLSQKNGIVTQRQQVLHSLVVKNQQLQDDLKLATSSAFIEQEARNKLGLVREGETVVIMDKSHPSAGGPDDQLKQTQELPSWKQWWRLFF